MAIITQINFTRRLMNRPIIMQIVLSVVAVLIAHRVVTRVRARAIGRVFAALWLAGVALFCLFVWKPELATRVSHALGIGRGVDALLYVGVALLFYLNLRLLLRLEQQDHTITKLVSELALLRHDHERSTEKK